MHKDQTRRDRRRNGPTSLSTSVLTKWLELLGSHEIQELLEIVFAQGLARYMSRIILIARQGQ